MGIKFSSLEMHCKLRKAAAALELQVLLVK